MSEKRTPEQRRRDMLHANYVRRVYAEENGRDANTYSAKHPAYCYTSLCSDKRWRRDVEGKQTGDIRDSGPGVQDGGPGDKYQ